MRVFVAVEPVPAVLAKLRELLGKLSTRAPSAKWVAPDGLHITLAFLGEIAEERLPLVVAATASAAALHGPLVVRIAKGGSFASGRRPRVLWLGVEGAVGALAGVHRDLEQALALSTGYAPEDRAFHAHLTLARSRDPRGDPALQACVDAIGETDFGETRVHELVVFRSDTTPQGARYTVVARVPLDAPGRDGTRDSIPDT